jgi:hypothetical protein
MPSKFDFGLRRRVVKKRLHYIDCIDLTLFPILANEAGRNRL